MGAPHGERPPNATLQLTGERSISVRSGPPLPPLRHLRALDAAEWLRTSLTTFATSVASILPGHFPAYARVYHPFDSGGVSPFSACRWHELAARFGVELRNPAIAGEFALTGVPNVQSPTGTLPPALIAALVEHLQPATITPAECFFAVWEGFGDSMLPPALPNRAYHVFAGPLAAASTSYSSIPFSHQSANLWWPADRAWCVATEVDFAWTYVGGPRSCIQALLTDPRLDALETTAAARW
jgi:hypothetical protein